MSSNNKFRVIIGGTAGKIKINNVVLEVFPDFAPTMPVDVRIFEEDTYLVLTVDRVMRYEDEHPIQLMTSIMDACTHKPGTVVRKNASWYAIVHDLDKEQMCRKEWIESAYEESLRLAEKEAIARLGLPLLGTVHGGCSLRNSLQLLISQLRQRCFSHPKKIVILVKKKYEKETRKLLMQLSG